MNCMYKTPVSPSEDLIEGISAETGCVFEINLYLGICDSVYLVKTLDAPLAVLFVVHV